MQNTGQYHMFTNQGEEKGMEYLFTRYYARTLWAASFLNNDLPVGRSGTGLLSVYGKKGLKLTTSNHL